MKPTIVDVIVQYIEDAAELECDRVSIHVDVLALWRTEVASLETANMHAQLTIDELREENQLFEAEAAIEATHGLKVGRRNVELQNLVDQLIVDKAELKKRLENAMAERGY